MAIIRYKNFDTTVETIADRNLVTPKIDNMVVTVKDAIADVGAGAGVATYRWNDSLNSWVIISRSTYDTVSFVTEELLIVNGSVSASNVPLDNTLWDINIISGDVITHMVRLEDLSVTVGVVSNLEAYSGSKIRFTYCHGSIATQINAALDNAVTDAVAEASAISGTVTDFEEGLI